MPEPIEIRITQHRGANAKWDYDYYGDRTRAEGYGGYYYYQHAKFRLPSGKPKYEKFSDGVTSEEILAAIQKKYSNFKFVLSTTESLNPNT